jgi:hypothetical protein
LNLSRLTAPTVSEFAAMSKVPPATTTAPPSLRTLLAPSASAPALMVVPPL